MEGGPWFSAKEDWQLTDTEILKAVACVHPKYFIGTRAGKASKYAVLDIDEGSPYHNASGFAKISALLQKAGIEGFNLYRSSHSGGWHIYIFFDAPVSSRDLYKQLHKLFALHDFDVEKGKLEIFPNPGNKSLGQGLRLPLQPGFAWLNEHNLTVREERDDLAPSEALVQFVRDIECSINPYHYFHKLRAFVERVESVRAEITVKAHINFPAAEVVPLRPELVPQGSAEAQRTVTRSFRKLPPGINCDSWLRGRHYYEHGLSAAGQRADAIFTMGHYLFYGDPERLISALGYGYEAERKLLIQEILKAKHNGKSKDISSGREEAKKQIERATSWLPLHRRNAQTERYESEVPISWVRNNANRALRAQKLICAAVEDFRESNMQFSTRDLAIKSGVSTRTIAKYPHLWKPAMEELRRGCLTGDLHEYNAGEGVTSPKSQPPVTSNQNVMPPGRLAARQIVYELRMRDQRTFRENQQLVQMSEKASSRAWQDRVAVLLDKAKSETSHRALIVLQNLLAHELLIAPCEEDCKWLSEHLGVLKERALSLGQSVQLAIDRSAAVS